MKKRNKKHQVPTGRVRSTKQKVQWLMLNDVYNLVKVSKELGITRPTLNSRLEKENWKKLEVERVSKLYKDSYLKAHNEGRETKPVMRELSDKELRELRRSKERESDEGGEVTEFIIRND